MKFHKQVKIPGMNQDQIVEALRESELEIRPMRTKYSFEKKFKTTNTFNEFNIYIQDEIVEVQGNGGYNVFSFTPYIARELLGVKGNLFMRYTKGDLPGYFQETWKEYEDSGREV